MDDKQFSLPGTSLPMYFDRFSHRLLGTLLCKPFPETWAFCIHSSSNMALFKSAPLLDLKSPWGRALGLIFVFGTWDSTAHLFGTWCLLKEMNGAAKDMKTFWATISSEKCIFTSQPGDPCVLTHSGKQMFMFVWHLLPISRHTMHSDDFFLFSPHLFNFLNFVCDLWNSFQN